MVEVNGFNNRFIMKIRGFQSRKVLTQLDGNNM